MKRIFFVALTLCCFAVCFARNSKKTLEEKRDAISEIHSSIIDGDLQGASAMLDDFVNRYGMTSDVYTLQAAMLEAEKKYDEALAKLDAAIFAVREDDVFDLSTLYGFKIGYAKRLEEKLAYADASLLANPKNANSLIARYKIYRQMERYKDAERDMKKLVKMSHGDPGFRVELVRIHLLEDENESRAVKELSSILKEYPNNANARELRALIYFYNENYEAFVDDYLYYLQMTGDNDMSYINQIADVKYEYILDYADKILNSALGPEKVAYWNYFEGNLKLVTGRDVEGAKRHLDTALEMTKDSGEFRGKLIALQVAYYAETGDEDKMLSLIGELEDLVRSLGNQPADWILHKKAILLRNKKRYDESAVCLSQLIDNGKLAEETDSADMSYYYYLRADLNRDAFNNPKGALDDIDSALTYRPDYLPFLYKRARICDKYFHYGEYLDQAKADCERILAIDTVPTADSYRHFAFAMLNRKEEAEAWYGRIVEEFGNNQQNRWLIYYNGACMYSIMNDAYHGTQLLMDALENGQFTCEGVNNDEDFDNIRETPEFKSVLKILCSGGKGEE